MVIACDFWGTNIPDRRIIVAYQVEVLVALLHAPLQALHRQFATQYRSVCEAFAVVILIMMNYNSQRIWFYSPLLLLHLSPTSPPLPY